MFSYQPVKVALKKKGGGGPKATKSEFGRPKIEWICCSQKIIEEVGWGQVINTYQYIF